MNNKQKELKREYQQTVAPMGVYQIRNLQNEKILVGSSLNLTGILNRNKFQLEKGGHPIKILQAEWNQFGADNFAFEILDELQSKEAPGHDYREDLAFLEELWLEKLQPYGERGYNEKKKSQEEKLRQIMAKRSNE